MIQQVRMSYNQESIKEESQDEDEENAAAIFN